MVNCEKGLVSFTLRVKSFSGCWFKQKKNTKNKIGLVIERGLIINLYKMKHTECMVFVVFKKSK